MANSRKAEHVGRATASLSTELGDFLRARREKTGQPQADIARTLDVSFTFISNIETGTRAVPFARFDDFARAYRVPLADLVHAAGACPTCRGTGRALSEKRARR
jgi:transcriptional regulator with XRE-family HTH domain